MFYEKQPKIQQENYKEMLALIGKLSRLFSDAKEPYLYYRSHENTFAKYFEATNLSREDCSADASKGRTGVGLKTWVGQNNQKVAEFGRLRPQYKDLKGLELVRKIAEFRNLRIQTTMNLHGLDEMIYHVVKRVPAAMQIYECAFDKINIEGIKLLPDKGNENSVYFTDGKHTYHFSLSKNTLYMNFDDMELMDSFDVDIIDDPFEVLSGLVPSRIPALVEKESTDQLCLRLYKVQKGIKFIEKSSSLNQWNGARTAYGTDENGIRYVKKVTPRDINELYIRYPAEDRARKVFFPPREEKFDLLLPDGQHISAKVCQDSGKAIMSDPNNALGKWLLRDVLNLKEGTIVTYEMLKEFGVDSVMFTKLGDRKYSIDFCTLGTYEKFYGLDDPDMLLDDQDE